MNTKLTPLRQRWQVYTPRERMMILLCGALIGAAAFWYGAYQPLVNMAVSSQRTIKRQLETLTWMRTEINSKHLPVRVIKTESVRNLVEISARELNISLNNVQQKEKTLTFSIAQIEFFQLKNWLREINLSSGARIEKIAIIPVDRRSVVAADVKMAWSPE